MKVGQLFCRQVRSFSQRCVTPPPSRRERRARRPRQAADREKGRWEKVAGTGKNTSYRDTPHERPPERPQGHRPRAPAGAHGWGGQGLTGIPPSPARRGRVPAASPSAETTPSPSGFPAGSHGQHRRNGTTVPRPGRRPPRRRDSARPPWRDGEGSANDR